MRQLIVEHAPSVTGFGIMAVIALLMGATIQAALPSSPPIVALPGPPIALPGPDDDLDRDSYADDVDLVDGDLNLRLHATALRFSGQEPYLVVGTQQDQWRLGDEGELRWPHVVDFDPHGLAPGSPKWAQQHMRTGAWWTSVPVEGGAKAIAATHGLGPDDGGDGVTWPQSFHVHVRDDRPILEVEVELYDAKPDPDRLHGQWTLSYDVLAATWSVGDQTMPSGEAADLTDGDALLRVSLAAAPDIDLATQDAIAQRWSPTIHFASGERFFPLPGQVMQEFHGIAAQAHDHRTWARDFNNARDAYLLFLADFNGDRTTDHRDAAVMIDLLRAGDRATPTVYTHVTNATNDQVIVQYWLLYAYNYVSDERGDDIRLLAHSGDREFIQLRFASMGDALQGRPIDITYSQHYKGIRFPDPGPGALPFQDETHLSIFVARGSHASYPAPGDDRALRPAFVAYGDIFDGEGETWLPGNYTLEHLRGQPWHAGYLWGPITRHHRDLGTASKPLLQHTFRYPFIDPVMWQQNRDFSDAESLPSLYGGE